MVCRAFLLSALLISGLLIGRLLHQPLLGSRDYYLLIGAGFGLTILYTLVHPLWSRSRVAASVQLSGDIVLITGFVWVTGGLTSPFSLIYFLPIIAASIMLGRAGALSSASASWFMYGFLVLLIVFHWIPEVPAGMPEALDGAQLNKRVAYALFSHFMGFFTVAHLASYLSQKLKVTGDELKEKREALAKIQALNKNIIDSITSGIVTTDLGGRITFMNRGAEEIAGRRLDELQNSSVQNLLGCEEGFFTDLAVILEKGRRHRFDSVSTRADGTTVHLGVSSAVLKDQRGRQLGYVFSCQDLTEIRALEEEIRLKEHMASLGEMAAGIAHEIRNPLASMSGSAQILRRGAATGDEDGELLEIIVSESRRLDEIIRNFLLFARPRRFEPQAAEIAPVLQDALTLLRNSEELRDDHEIRVDIEDDIRATCDVNLIKQVVWNLSRNALKAMPDGGALTVSARHDGARGVRISFADEGIGMRDEEIQRMFEPFHGGFGDGCGLGLSVVFRIVEQHHGRISISSRPGSGTEVVVTLPAAESLAMAVAASS